MGVKCAEGCVCKRHSGEPAKEWAAAQTPEWRRERARRAAKAMHAMGRTNTAPARAAWEQTHGSEYMRWMAYRSHEARRQKAAKP